MVVQRRPGYHSMRSLAQVKRDEDLEIGHIAFDATRERCLALGLEFGAVVRCVASRDWDIVLRTAANNEVVIDRSYAVFIEVLPVAQPRSLAPRGGDGPQALESLVAVPPSLDPENRP